MAKTASGFGLRHVAVAARPSTPATPPVWIDIPAVTAASFILEVEEVEQYGDDQLLGVFYHTQKGMITVTSTKIATDVIAAVTGNAIVTSGAAETLPIGTEAELIPPRVMVRAVVPVTYEDGSAGEEEAVWYNCTVKTAYESMPGNTRAEIQNVNLSFRTFRSSQDENGDPLTIAAHGKMTF